MFCEEKNVKNLKVMGIAGKATVMARGTLKTILIWGTKSRPYGWFKFRNRTIQLLVSIEETFSHTL